MDRAKTAYKHWRHEQDAQGLVWLTFDKQGESANTFSREALQELSAILDEIKLMAPKGMASICIGGGLGGAMLVEAL